MIILGLDPGSRRIGYGIIEETGSKTSLVDAGLLPIQSSNDPEALAETEKQYRKLLAKHNPQLVGIEKLFFMKNRTTGIAVSQARGVLLATTVSNDIPLIELTPNQVKQGLTGYGGADKNSIMKMVRIILHEPNLKLIDDAMDALAIALVSSRYHKIS